MEKILIQWWLSPKPISITYINLLINNIFFPLLSLSSLVTDLSTHIIISTENLHNIISTIWNRLYEFCLPSSNFIKRHILS